MNRLLWAIPVLALALGLTFWWTQGDGAPRNALKTEVTPTALAKPEPKLAGRTYLSPAQLREAYQAGELDRPIKSLIAIDRRLDHGQYRWDETGVPDGPTWIRVDLKSQILSVFRAGHEIGTAVILYGAQSKQTPPGTYPIMARMRQHRSSLYDADMPFTLRLTGDGISIHGSNVRWGAATHGCIGVPPGFAEKLFDSVSVKDEVVVLGKERVARSASTS